LRSLGFFCNTRHPQDAEKCAFPKSHYPFIRSSLFADLVKGINVQSGGLATRARAALGIISPALRPEREVLSLDWDRPGRVADLSEE
jgi:hypothetical protein